MAVPAGWRSLGSAFFIVAALTFTPAAAALAAPPSTAPALDSIVPHAAKPGPTGSVVPGQYIVTFRKNTPSDTVRHARQAASKAGAAVHRDYRAAMVGFAASLSPKALNELQENPSVATIEPDRKVSLADVQPSPTWGLDRH